MCNILNSLCIGSRGKGAPCKSAEAEGSKVLPVVGARDGLARASTVPEMSCAGADSKWAEGSNQKVLGAEKIGSKKKYQG